MCTCLPVRLELACLMLPGFTISSAYRHWDGAQVFTCPVASSCPNAGWNWY